MTPLHGNVLEHVSCGVIQYARHLDAPILQPSQIISSNANVAGMIAWKTCADCAVSAMASVHATVESRKIVARIFVATLFHPLIGGTRDAGK